MNSNDIPLENLPDPFALEQPCCDQELLAGDGGQELPDVATLQQELEALEGGAEADELLFADVGQEELTFQQELELAGLGKEPLPPLEEIVSIAERYPGLKISFSF
jgi:hypothetical protein